MSSYDYSIVAADAMSLLPLQENLHVLMPGCIIHQMDHLDNTTVDFANIRRCALKDSILSKVYQTVKLYDQEQIYQRGPSTQHCIQRDTN